MCGVMRSIRHRYRFEPIGRSVQRPAARLERRCVRVVAPRAAVEALSGVSKQRRTPFMALLATKAQSSGAQVHRRRDRGQLPEAYYDVHASQFLMFVLVVSGCYRRSCVYAFDRFVVQLYFAVRNLSQWRGKISHAQHWAENT